MSFTCWMKYSTGNPATVAFSGRPRPSARWQNPHAITAGFLPCITIGGAGRWVAGFQSATSNRLRVRPTVNLARLVGTVTTTAVSVPVAFGAVAEPSTGNAHAGTSNEG